MAERTLTAAPDRRRSCRACRYLWLGVFFLVPFLIVLKISLSDPAVAQPPYTPVFDWSDMAGFFGGLDFENFALLVERRSLSVGATLSSVRIAADLDAAAAPRRLSRSPTRMARAPERSRPLLVALVILPFWTSFLIRIYAWIGILKPEGLAQPGAHGPRPDRRAARHPQHRDGGLYRHRLRLSAVHGAAALRDAREDGRHADRGGARSRLAAVARVLDDHRAARHARHRRRLAPVLHPGRRRVRHPGSSRRLGDADDRPAALERVLLQPRLAARLRGRDPAAHHPRRARS